MNVLASPALSLGKNLRTFGNVLSNFNIPSSNELPSSCFFFFIKSATTDLLCPKFFIVNDPTLFIRITSGMLGKTRTASS